MNRKLFWKILLMFWLIFYLTFQLTWLGFAFYYDKRVRQPFEHIPTTVNFIAELLHISGENAAMNFLHHLPEKQRGSYSIKQVSSAIEPINIVIENREDDSFFYQQTTTSPEGNLYLVAFVNKEDEHRMKTIFNMPVHMIWMGILVGLLFSSVLAWNLTRPLKLLRKAFYQVSLGNLKVRLFDRLKRRHDELSEVAKDFDAMVEQLDVLISARQALLHDVSHELRTPLARLQLAIGLAQQNKLNIDNSLNRIELESERLDKLIEEILTYSRTDVGEVLDEYFDLVTLIRIIVDDATYEATPQNVQIKLELGIISNPIVKGNSEQARRAIENIIRNAIRFSEQGQAVDVSLMEVGKYLQIQVRDYGPGVDEHKLSSIFEPFVRIQPSKQGKGYGLGLAIARKVINMHNGEIKATNSDTKGLVVTIKLPYWIIS